MEMKKFYIMLIVFAAVFSAANASLAFKVGTYNIRYYGASGDTGWKDWTSRRAYVVQTITKYDYDLIGLNECRGGPQLDYMVENLASDYAYVNIDDDHGGYNPIFFKKDKFELLASGRFFLNADDLTQPILSWDNSNGNYRFTAWVKLRLKASGEILFFFETHLDHQGETARNEQARINMEQIRKIAAGFPAIICGDHNASKSRVPYFNMKSAYMDDSYSVAKTKYNVEQGVGTLCKHKVNGRDFWDPAYKGSSRLDYIWVRGIDVDEYRHIDDTFGHEECPSDHIAIQATVSLRGFVAQHRVYVDPQGGDGDGTIDNPMNDLQKAVDAIVYPGDTIFVKAGKLTVAGKGKTATVKISKTVTILGGYNDDFTRVVGMTEMDGDLNGDDVYDNFAIRNTSDNLYRLITLSNSSALELSNFDLHGANAPQTSSMGQGAAVYCPGYRLKLENCWVHDNVAYSNGAGVYSAGALDLLNCRMFDNISLYGSGGAFYTANYSGELYWRMSVRDCQFYGNKAKNGGAGYNGGFSWLCVTGCSFHDNKVADSGIFDIIRTGFDSNVAFANNVFANNILESTPNAALGDATKGGSAILIKLNGEGSNVALVNNTIVGNTASCMSATGSPSATFSGAAVQTLSDCTVRLWNNIIAGNTSSATTGGDVHLANTVHVASHRNVYTCAEDVGIALSATDFCMSARADGIAALAAMLNGKVEDGRFVANVTDEKGNHVVAVRKNVFGGNSINDVHSEDLVESVFVGDVTHNGQMREWLSDDQRGVERRTDGTASRGAYEEGQTIPEKEYTFGQYNIRILTSDDTGAQAWANRKDYVAGLIKKYGYDVCSLNEIKAGTQYSNLKELLPDYSFYAHSVSSATIEERETMNAVAWKTDRFSLLDKGVWFISSDPLNTARVLSDSRQSRNTVWAKLQDKQTGVVFFYFATHLDHIGKDARREGAKINIDMVRKIAGNYPCILGGDHNSGEGDQRVDMPLRSFFKSAGTECPPADGKKATHNGFSPEVAVGGTPIDFIYAHNTKIKSYTIIRDTMGNPDGITPSDHFSLMSRMELLPFVACRRQLVSDNVQAAIDAAECGDTICLQAGTLKESIRISKSLTLIGGYNEDFSQVTGRTVFDGTEGGFAHVISIDAGTYCELENINVIGGNAVGSDNEQGGGIYSKAWYLTLTNCDIADNMAADKGGGVYAMYQLQATNCKFSNNRCSGNGGGFYTSPTSNWRYTFNNCLFERNTAANGGAGYINGMIRGYFKGNSFVDNTARQAGGALCLGNKDSQAYTLTLLNNTFASNAISETGGNGGSALFASLYKDAELQTASTTLNLVANTIVGNKGNNAAVVVASGYMGLYNNIIAGNKGGDVALNGNFVASENNVYTVASALSGITNGATDLVGADEKSSLASLATMLNAKVEDGLLVPVLSPDNIPVLYIYDPYFCEKKIVAVQATWTTESKLKADLNDDTAIMTQKYTDDQLGKNRKSPYTIGAVEYDAALGIDDVSTQLQIQGSHLNKGVYNLQGQKVTNMVKGNIYIINNKAVIY